MNKIKLYLPLFLLSLIAFTRVYISCFKSVQNSCLEPKASFFGNIEKFPGKQLEDFRNHSVDLMRKYLPSPHSELLAGMVIGVDELGKIPRFKEALKTTGTIHVVVVSGFNISLVSNLIMGFLGSKYKARNLFISQFFTLLYSIMTGFEPPVIRAWIMGIVLSWVRYYGRSVDGFRALIFTALLMIVIWPYFLLSVSFQLSFLATLGLIVFGNPMVDFISGFLGKSFFVEDLGTTISAQIFVLPIVSYYFGRVSIISFLVNPLILWTVPIATVLGTFFIFIANLSSFLAKIMSIVIYPFLDVFISSINFFSQFSFSSVNFSIGIAPVVIYYLFVLVLARFSHKIKI